MARSNRGPDWNWAVTPEGDFLGKGGCLTFARGISERDMLLGFEMDPDSARPMTAAELPEGPLLGQPGFYEGPTWVRVAKEGEWAIGIEDRIFKAFLENIVERVSLGTESVAVSWTTRGNATIIYHRDGLHISTFSTSPRDPLFSTTGSHDSRTGPERNYFDEALAARGFAESEPAEVSELPLAERMVVLLGILSELFGIRLSPETYNSPLLTAYRTTQYRYGPWKNPDPRKRVTSASSTTPSGPRNETFKWEWFTDQLDVLARSLTFARETSIPDLIESFEMDAGVTEEMTWSDAEARFCWERGFNEPPYWIRLAQLGSWTVAFEYNQILSLFRSVPALSPDVSVFEVTWTITTATQFKARTAGRISSFDSVTSRGSHDDYLAELTAPLRHLVDDPSIDHQSALLAVFTDVLEIPPFTLEQRARQ